MMTAVEGMHGGLNALAESLRVERLGPMHQAGSDSLLTAKAFFTFAQRHLGENWDEKRSLVAIFTEDYSYFFLDFEESSLALATITPNINEIQQLRR